MCDNDTWEVVPRPNGAHIICCLWIYRHKFHAHGSLESYKTRLLVNGKSQQVGIDVEDTFNSIFKLTTIRIVLTLKISCSWPIHQLDVKNAFFHGHLTETVLMHQPLGFVDQSHPDYICRLHRSLYGVKQAPRARYHQFATYVTSHGFKSTSTHTSLFVY